MINKRGQTGSSVMTMYRVLLVIILAVVILGISAVIYSHHINVRDSEAMLMVRAISGCVISDAVVDLSELRGEKNLFEYCGFEDEEVERFFVSVLVKVDGEEVRVNGGDSGLLWVKDIFDGGARTGTIDKYEPGHFERSFDVVVLDGVEKDGELIVEVVANAE